MANKGTFFAKHGVLMAVMIKFKVVSDVTLCSLVDYVSEKRDAFIFRKEVKTGIKQEKDTGSMSWDLKKATTKKRRGTRKCDVTDGGSTLHRNTDKFLTDYVMSIPGNCTIRRK
jgi:hypothetical protein